MNVGVGSYYLSVQSHVDDGVVATRRLGEDAREDPEEWRKLCSVKRR